MILLCHATKLLVVNWRNLPNKLCWIKNAFLSMYRVMVSGGVIETK